MIVRIGKGGKCEQRVRSRRRLDSRDHTPLDADDMIRDGGPVGRRQHVRASDVAHAA